MFQAFVHRPGRLEASYGEVWRYLFGPLPCPPRVPRGHTASMRIKLSKQPCNWNHLRVVPTRPPRGFHPASEPTPSHGCARKSEALRTNAHAPRSVHSQLALTGKRAFKSVHNLCTVSIFSIAEARNGRNGNRSDVEHPQQLEEQTRSRPVLPTTKEPTTTHGCGTRLATRWTAAHRNTISAFAASLSEENVCCHHCQNQREQEQHRGEPHADKTKNRHQTARAPWRLLVPHKRRELAKRTSASPLRKVSPARFGIGALNNGKNARCVVSSKVKVPKHRSQQKDQDQAHFESHRRSVHRTQ